MDGGDGVGRGAAGLDGLFEPESEERSVAGGDEEAGHELEAEAVAGGAFAGLQRGVDAVAIGDSEDIELGAALDALEDLVEFGLAFAAAGFDVEIGTAEADIGGEERSDRRASIWWWRGHRTAHCTAAARPRPDGVGAGG